MTSDIYAISFSDRGRFGHLDHIESLDKAREEAIFTLQSRPGLRGMAIWKDDSLSEVHVQSRWVSVPEGYVTPEWVSKVPSTLREHLLTNSHLNASQIIELAKAGVPVTKAEWDRRESTGQGFATRRAIVESLAIACAINIAEVGPEIAHYGRCDNPCPCVAPV